MITGSRYPALYQGWWPLPALSLPGQKGFHVCSVLHSQAEFGVSTVWTYNCKAGLACAIVWSVLLALHLPLLLCFAAWLAWSRACLVWLCTTVGGLLRPPLNCCFVSAVYAASAVSAASAIASATGFHASFFVVTIISLLMPNWVYFVSLLLLVFFTVIG